MNAPRIPDTAVNAAAVVLFYRDLKRFGLSPDTKNLPLSKDDYTRDAEEALAAALPLLGDVYELAELRHMIAKATAAGSPLCECYRAECPPTDPNDRSKNLQHHCECPALLIAIGLGQPHDHDHEPCQSSFGEWTEAPSE